MLGSTAFRYFSGLNTHETWGTLRSPAYTNRFPKSSRRRLLTGIDVLEISSIAEVLARLTPDVVINCVGVVKQLDSANDPLTAIPLNALFPHQLAKECDRFGARCIHISTDCVFSGRIGGYRESDPADARDLYGLSKLLGEVAGEGAITLRTSIIGHELGEPTGLLEWFLAQTGEVRGYREAHFSGLTTLELSRVIEQYVMPNTAMSGLYHVSADRIAKFDLLNLIRSVYRKDVSIVPDSEVVIDRSLNSETFQLETGYQPKSWPTMIEEMHEFHTMQGEPDSA